MLSLFGIVLAVTLLIAGGAMLVRSASAIAAGFGVSPVVLGLTTVGFSTSSPELFKNVHRIVHVVSSCVSDSPSGIAII